MAAIDASAAKRGSRLAALDLIRGVAILAMIVYHLGWDLSANGMAGFDAVNDPIWRISARLIAGTFLALVGVNLVLAERGGFRIGPYLRRLAIIAAAAALVTLGTYWLFPQAFVFFGILHAIVVSSVIALPFLRAPLWLTGIAAVICLAAPRFLTSSFFDAPWWLWLGLSANPPPSVDYVPMLPWFGVVLFGMIGGRRLIASGGSAFAAWRPSALLPRFLIQAGRWSLAIYLVHQPILLGALTVLAPLIGPNEAAIAARYGNDCAVSCLAVGHDQPTCETYCGCVVDRLQGDEALFADARHNRLTDDQRQRWQEHIEACQVQHLPPLPATDGSI